MPINNMPDANELWKGIGGYFDSLGEILCEFIDNSISNFNGNKTEIRAIFIRFFVDNDKVRIRVVDSGTGIKNLDAAFTLGSHDGAESLLNEHGFGFKHALASANPTNDAWKILTCTEEDSNNQVYKEIKAPYLLGTMPVNEIHKPWPVNICKTGTIIEFYCSIEMFRTISRGLPGNYTRTDTLLSVLKEDLGFIYSGVLVNSNGGVQISLVEENAIGETISRTDVGQITPIWEGFYETEQRKRQGSENVDLGSGTVKVEYVFGKISESTENKKYYKRNMASSGAEIRINGRLLAYNLIKPIWKKENHNAYNQFLAIINLVSDDPDKLPRTKTSKNGLREGDIHLVNLFTWISQKFPNIPRNSDPIPDEDIDERFLFQQLAEAKKTHLRGNPTVETELYAYDSLGEKIRMDLYIADGMDLIIYEGKKDKTTVKDLYQLIMYWDGCVFDGKKPTEAILISAQHPDSVKRIVSEIRKMYDSNNNNYNIVLKTWKDEGINYPE